MLQNKFSFKRNKISVAILIIGLLVAGYIYFDYKNITRKEAVSLCNKKSLNMLLKDSKEEFSSARIEDDYVFIYEVCMKKYGFEK